MINWKRRVKSSWPLLVLILRQDRSCKSLNEAEWDLLLRQAKRSQLVGKLYFLLEEQDLLRQVPAGPFRHLYSAIIQADKQHRDFLWEVGKLKLAFSDTGCSLLLLKGGAYAVAQLKPYKGRLFSDIDILVPFAALNQIEKRLMVHGWLQESKDNYDQQYYRRWMHEIPPLHHVKRGSVVDLHHNILPRTAVACPDANLLLESAIEFAGEYEGIKVLSALDRIIHSATHLFYEGELEHGLRDLVDLDGLMSELDGAAKISLVERSLQLGLDRPVYYALRYMQLILKTADLDAAMRAFNLANVIPIHIKWMDVLFLRALMPDHPSCNDRWTGLARWLLYIRSHWLKMPWYLLLPHLSRKAWMRLTGKQQH